MALKKLVLLGIVMMSVPTGMKAQKWNVIGKVDFVSDYIWRGAYQNSGFSVQPT